MPQLGQNVPGRQANQGIQASQSAPQQFSQADLQHLLNQPFFASNIGQAGLGQQASAINLTLMHLVQSALQMNVAVGTFPDDEQRLIQALHDGGIKKQTKRLALEALHGVNNHPAMAWKDYYLEHVDRLDQAAANLQHPVKPETVEKSSTSQSSSSNTGRQIETQVSASLHRLTDQDEHHKGHPYTSASTRETNTYRAHGERHDRRVIKSKRSSDKPATTVRRHVEDVVSLHPTHNNLRIPELPSRTPSPPLSETAPRKGKRFMEEDKDFFIKFIQRKLSKNPYLKQAKLCALLAEKAPYHSAASWSSYWLRHHDLPDKILAAARKKAVAQNKGLPEHSSSGNNECGSDSGLLSAGESDVHQGITGTKRPTESDYDTEDDLRNMGHSGDQFLSADLRVLARHVASQPNWDFMTRTEQWKPFAAKHSRRSLEAYAQAYGRFKTEIDRWVRKFRRGAKKAKAGPSSQPGPSKQTPEIQEVSPSAIYSRKRRASTSASVEAIEKRLKTDLE
ncbi:hypothetical protein BKA93DRAFT_827615 [Sparassis latifolia]